MGFEPMTYGLRNRCSTTELRWQFPQKLGRAISATAARMARDFPHLRGFARRRGLGLEAEAQSFAEKLDRALQLRLLVILLRDLFVDAFRRLESGDRFAALRQRFELRERLCLPI